ncbi:unnamed protein product [Peniophora sp. CBMAI 1063]|nr:unnamed protein product [Peniophora sp. CBMAI 1063]
MSAVIARKLWLLRARLTSTALLMVTALLILTCTAHAFLYLADLIDGITSTFTAGNPNSDPRVEANDFFQNATRTKILAAFFLYVFVSVCNNLFVTWRVYVYWGRNKVLAGLLVSLILASVVANAVCGHFLVKDHAEGFGNEEAAGKSLFTAGWILSIVMQVAGALLIGWHSVETPIVVGNGEQEKRNILQTLFYAFVEAGCLSLITELFMIGFLYRNWAVALVFLAVLGQISGLSALAIILREIFKAERDSLNGFVNVTSALAAMQMQDFSHRRGQRSIGPSDMEDVHGNAVMVDIETSRHEDDAEKPISQKYRSRAVGKILLHDIEREPST